MKAGLLDRRVTIERATIARDPVTNEPVSAWAEVRTVWGAVAPDGEDEAVHGSREVAFALIKVRIRFLEGIEPTDRLVVDGDVFDLRGIREIGRREGLEMKARRIEPGDA